MPAKILIVNWRDIKNPEAGGAEVHYHEIFRRLDPARYTVSVLASSVPGLPADEVIDGIQVHRRGKRSTFNYWVYANIGSFVKAHGADLIFDDVNKIPFFLPRFVKKPVVAMFHHLFNTSIFHEFGFPLASYVYLSEKLISPAYRDTPFTAVSQSTFNELLGMGFKADRGRIIHNGIDLERYTPAGSRDPFHLLFVGRIKRYKNVSFLIRLFRELRTLYPQARLTIAGGGDYLNTLMNEAKDLDEVRFAGFVPQEEKIALYRKASVFVNPSVKEGWSITNIEACACGMPVVAADVPGLRDSVKNHENGYLFEYNNIDSCIQALRKILDHAPETEALRIKSRRFSENYSWDRSTRETEALIREIL